MIPIQQSVPAYIINWKKAVSYTHLDVYKRQVLKKGGAFALQDMFAQKALYGDMEQFVDCLLYTSG